jgi:hypothetical protein
LEKSAEKKSNATVDDIIFQLKNYLLQSTKADKLHENIKDFSEEKIKVKLSYPHKNFVEIKAGKQIFQINRQGK